MSVFKYCGESAIYDPELDSCLPCKDTCRECFKKVDQCSSCFPRQFLNADFTCSTCEQGCYTCQNAESCQVCDEDNHWTLQDLHCTCSEGYLFINNATCDSCSSFMSECTQCNSTDVCEACSEDYELNPETKHCDKKSSGGVLIIILIILAVIAVAVMAVLVWKWLQKKKAAKISSALEEEVLDDYEKVDN